MKLTRTEGKGTGQCQFYVSIDRPECLADTDSAVYVFEHSGMAVEVELCRDHLTQVRATANREAAENRRLGKVAK